MIKMLNLWAVSILLTICCTSLNAQYNPNQIVVVFDSNLTQAEIVLLLANDFNFEIVDGPTPVTEAYLCEPINGIYPPWAYGNPGGPINGIIEGAKGNSDVDGVSLNYDTFDGLESNGEGGPGGTNPCPGSSNMVLSIHQMGINAVRTAVSDTGISPDDYFGAYMDMQNPASWGANFIEPGSAPLDDNGHGTNMASIIVEHIPDNGQGGVLSPVDLKTYKTHNQDGLGYLFNKIQAIDAAIIAGVQVLNMSYSYIADHEHRYETTPFSIALDNTLASGILCVASAGNEFINNDSPEQNAYYPASFTHDNILSVAAVDCNGDIAPWSNYGNQSIDIAAPGINIPALGMNGEWMISTGTSPANALVSSLATQLGSYQVNFDYEEVKCAIINGNSKTQNLGFFVLSGGHINADGALDALFSGDACSYGGSGGGVVYQGFKNNDGLSKVVKASMVDDRIEVSIDAEQEVAAQVYVSNTLGQLLHSESVNLMQGNTSIELNWHAPGISGIYLISVQIENKIETTKIFR